MELVITIRAEPSAVIFRNQERNKGETAASMKSIVTSVLDPFLSIHIYEIMVITNIYYSLLNIFNVSGTYFIIAEKLDFNR